jgi:[acyl-carrier-protein] S-malonyltransferase
MGGSRVSSDFRAPTMFNGSPNLPSGIALLFPGQGSQTEGMRDFVARHAPALLEAAESQVGPDLFERVHEGTRFAQPAIFCASLAGWYELGKPAAAQMAGHSLGELAALVAADALTEAGGLELAVRRGKLMQEAVDASPGCGMLAVRASRETVEPVAVACGASVANDNAPRQIVVAGAADALERASGALRELGIRSMRLPVAGAFHSPLMQPAVAGYEKALAATELREPCCAVYSAMTARPFADVRAELAGSLTAPVRWCETVLALAADGATRFVELGPGAVLTGLVRRILPEADAGAPVAAEVSNA